MLNAFMQDDDISSPRRMQNATCQLYMSLEQRTNTEHNLQQVEWPLQIDHSNQHARDPK